ncbi:unnamed protein product [Phaedon cochleariae]|uniref:Palmitoyltransferase n=1 Tax=Phaedon cochleariae TaxID=80249 RepID=A0A9P0DSB7_PHACE|nr:unnamed protein product [Phaedon cochleariae]
MSCGCQCHLYIGTFILISLLISSYHIYVVGFCFSIEMSVTKWLLNLISFNILFVMMIWSLLYTMFEPIAMPPAEYKLTEDELKLYVESADDEKNYVLLEVYNSRYFTLKTRTLHGFLRYCRICKLLKPDRAHHCSTCGVCVLKMDHHCPWLNNCIGYTTQKSFLLCLFYCTSYCVFFMGTTYRTFSYYWQSKTRRNIHVPAVIGFFIAAVLGSITGIFLCFHVMLMFKNKTTIENSSNPSIFVSRNHTFDLGSYRNLTDVMGKNWIAWFFPGFSGEGDGCYFETRKLCIRRGSHTSLASRLSRASLRSHISHVPGTETMHGRPTLRLYRFNLPPIDKAIQRQEENVISSDEEIDTLFRTFSE